MFAAVRSAAEIGTEPPVRVQVSAAQIVLDYPKRKADARAAGLEQCPKVPAVICPSRELTPPASTCRIRRLRLRLLPDLASPKAEKISRSPEAQHSSPPDPRLPRVAWRFTLRPHQPRRA